MSWWSWGEVTSVERFAGTGRKITDMSIAASKSRTVSLAGLIGVVVLMLSACGGQGTETTDGGGTTTTEPPEIDYVALGDSYAAMGSREAPTTGPQFCRRAVDNYPSHVMADARVTDGTDVSCQGATIPDLTQPRPTGAEELPPQFDALDTGTELVTLSIGGNDLGFGEIVGCVQQSMVGERQVDCVAEFNEPLRQRLGQLPAQLDDVYSRIGDLTGGAEVITTGYLPILTPGQVCPQVEAISESDREWAADLTADLNRVLSEAAERNGAEFVLPENVADHTACAAPEERWVGILGNETGSHPMHPTAAGQAAMADAVLAEL